MPRVVPAGGAEVCGRWLPAGVSRFKTAVRKHQQTNNTPHRHSSPPLSLRRIGPLPIFQILKPFYLTVGLPVHLRIHQRSTFSLWAPGTVSVEI